MSKRKSSSILVLLVILLLVTVLTWIIPAGKFARDEANMVIPGSYEYVEASPVGPWGFFLSIFDGFVNGGQIIFFLMFSAAYTQLLIKTNAFHAAVGALLRVLGNKDILIIPVFTTLFSLAGATVGLGQATYALVPVFSALCIALGYDRLVGAGIVLVGAGVGFASALTNPSTVVIASEIAGIPLITPSYLAFRVVALLFFTAATSAYITWYAFRIRRNPEKSYEYGYSTEDLEQSLGREEIKQLDFTMIQKLSISGFVLLIAAVIWGSISFNWGMREMSAVFLIAFIITGVANRLGADEIVDTFATAAKAMIMPALTIALAQGLSQIMTMGSIIDTVVNGMGVVFNILPAGLSAVGLLVIQTLINFFIPSGSGQAVAVMPIMTPLADVVGLPRFAAVTAYQYGDGFSNFIWPTANTPQIAVTGTGFTRWYKFMLPWYGIMFVLQCVFVVASAMLM